MHPLGAGFRPGNNWITCDRCGFDHRASDVRKEWTGAIVCEPCWEPRQPQDFVRAVEDRQSPGIVRTRPEDKFTDVTYAADTDAHAIPSTTFGADID